MKYDIPYMTTEAVSLLKSLISIPSISREETIQNRQGFYVSCIEEIAWRQGWIPTEQLLLLGQQLEKTEYGKYLIELAKQS